MNYNIWHIIYVELLVSLLLILALTSFKTKEQRHAAFPVYFSKDNPGELNFSDNSSFLTEFFASSADSDEQIKMSNVDNEVLRKGKVIISAASVLKSQGSIDVQFENIFKT